ncbi:MAG: hypothetical protein QOH56_1346 [Pseudonocardiales bacterium]|jgi:3-oxoacyl-[acyl-carrier protein] reductase|nr:hypothetical protein [Pseudonocardiales bacterium]
MSAELAGRSVVVTGASRGVGRAFALALADAGARLVINGRDADALDSLAEDLRGRAAEVVSVAGSVAETDVARSLIQRCVSSFGRVDALINNAGIVRDRTTLKMSPDEFDDVIAVNLGGAWRCGRFAAEAMRETGGGSIINIVSEVAFYGAVGQSNYAASKAGLVALTVEWALELGRYGIRANAVSPAALTDMSAVVLRRASDAARAAGQPAPDPRGLGIGMPDEIAPLILYLASDRSAEVTGQVFSFNGRDVGVWSHPHTASVLHAPGWSPQAFDDAVAGGRLTFQATHIPNWMPT